VSLIVELELLQPIHYAPNSLGQRTLFSQDIYGSAWFDDVTVSQVPKVTMSTGPCRNIFRRSDPLVLKVLVNDRFTDDLAAQLVITDADRQGRFSQRRRRRWTCRRHKRWGRDRNA